MNSGGFFIPWNMKQSSIDELLNRSDLKFEELLDNEEFLFELKNCNPKLIDYMTKNKENLKQLIDFIIVMPGDPEDSKRAHKYPFLASEIFEADLAPLLNAFFMRGSDVQAGNDFKKPTAEDFEVISDDEHGHQNGKQKNQNFGISEGKAEEHKDFVEINDTSNHQEKNKNGEGIQTLLDYLFSFLESQEPLNPVLSGYFNKLVVSLLKRNHKKMVEFVYSKPSILQNMTRNIAQRSIAELLLNFIAYDPMFYDERSPTFQQMKLEVIERLLLNFKKNQDLEVLNNSACIITELIMKNEIVVDGREMYDKIMNEKTIDLLFSQIDAEDSTSLSNIGMALHTIISFYNPGIRRNDPYLLTSTIHEENEYQPIIDVLVRYVPMISKLFDISNTNSLTTQYGTLPHTMGSGRVKMIEIIEKLMRLYSKRVNTAVAESKKLFDALPWNNILHSAVEKLLVSIIDINDDLLIKYLFEDLKLLETIAHFSKEEFYVLARTGRKVRKGNLGHLTRIANMITRYATIDERITDYIKGSQIWQTFAEGTLKQTNETDNVLIGGFNPRDYTAALPGDQYMSFQNPASNAQEIMFDNSQEQSFGENKGLVLNIDVDPKLDTDIPSIMAVSQQARQDAFLSIDEQGLQAITHEPGPRSPKLGNKQDFAGLDNWSPEITAKRRSLSGSNMSTNSPNKPFDPNSKVKSKDLEDDEINPDRIRTPEKTSIDSDTDLPINPGSDSKENKPFTDEGTIMYQPGVIEEKVDQKIGRIGSPDKSGIDNSDQSDEIQPLEGLMIPENKAQGRIPARRTTPILSQSMYVDSKTKHEFTKPSEADDTQSLRSSTIFEKKKGKYVLKISNKKIREEENPELKDILKKISSARKSLPSKNSGEKGHPEGEFPKITHSSTDEHLQGKNHLSGSPVFKQGGGEVTMKIEGDKENKE